MCALALCYISHISGEHPLSFALLGKTLCETCRLRHGRDSKGQKQQL